MLQKCFSLYHAFAKNTVTNSKHGSKIKQWNKNPFTYYLLIILFYYDILCVLHTYVLQWGQHIFNVSLVNFVQQCFSS